MGRSRLLTKIAKDIDTSGNLTADAISSDVNLGGATIYSTRSSMPMTGNTQGDQAYVTGNNRLYIWNGSGWYNVALLNIAPSITSIQDSDGGTTPFTLATDGATQTVITIVAADSDGDPITYSVTKGGGFDSIATLSQDSSVFTITPFSRDSAGVATSGTLTFQATDGINTATSAVQTFTIDFVSADWADVLLSISYNDAVAYQTSNNDNSVFVDRSTNSFSITSANDPGQTAFHPYLDKWSVEFDGNDDYLTLTAGNLGSGDFTVEAWINYTEYQAFSTLYDNRSTASSSTGFYFGSLDLNTNKIGLYTAGANRFEHQTTIELSTWYHVALVRSSNVWKIYVNGVESTSSYTSSANISDTNLGIGTARTYLAGDVDFHGHISNLRTVTGTALYTSDFTPPTEKLTAVSGTSLLICQSNRFIDNSTNAYTLTAVGTPEVSAFNPFGQGSEYDHGENKGSVYLNGSDEYVGIPDNDDFELTGDFTIELWMYYISGTATYPAIIGGNGSGSNGWNLYVAATNKIAFWHGSFLISGNNNDFIPNSWNHIALTRSGSDLKLFVNGEQTGSTTSSATFNQGTANSGSRIGYDIAANGYIKGYFADVKIQNGTAAYTSAFTPPTSPLTNSGSDTVLYLPMDNPGFFDKTGNCELTLGTYASSTVRSTGAYEMATHYGYYGQLEVELPVSLGDLEFTIEWWARQSVSNSGNQIVFEAGDATNGVKVRYEDVRSKLETIVSGTSSTGTSSSKTFYNVLYHHALTRQSDGSFRLYRNGVLILTNTNSVTIPGNTVKFGSIAGYMEGMQILINNVKYTTSGYTNPTGIQGRSYQAES